MKFHTGEAIRAVTAVTVIGATATACASGSNKRQVAPTTPSNTSATRFSAAPTTPIVPPTGIHLPTASKLRFMSTNSKHYGAVNCELKPQDSVIIRLPTGPRAEPISSAITLGATEHGTNAHRIPNETNRFIGGITIRHTGGFSYEVVASADEPGEGVDVDLKAVKYGKISNFVPVPGKSYLLGAAVFLDTQGQAEAALYCAEISSGTTPAPTSPVSTI